MICEVIEKTSPSLGRVEGEERAYGEGWPPATWHSPSPETGKLVSDPREGG